MMPKASGLYDPDAFTDVDIAKGVTWVYVTIIFGVKIPHILFY